MSILDSIKPFWPLLFTIILPKAYGYFNALKTAYRTRPPPTALPARVDRSLNILFCSILFFFIQSFPRGPQRDIQNVFSTTNTRLGVPLDILFARLASIRPDGLSATDNALRSALNTKDARLIYLTYGPDALLSCSFCHPSRPITYMLYALPKAVLLPHFIHFLIIGLATSGAITSPLSARSRLRFLFAALGLFAIDIYLNTLFSPYPTLITPTAQPATSLYTLLKIARPLSICALDALFALYIWSTTTNRFIFFPFLVDPTSSTNPSIETLQAQSQELVRNAAVALQIAQGKIRAANIARNAVMRDNDLKGRENQYWAEVNAVEGEDSGVWQDEEVQAAIARVYGMGGVDVPKARKDASAFVDGITNGLERANKNTAA